MATFPFTTRDERKVRIEVDDATYEVSVFDPAGRQIGEFTFAEEYDGFDHLAGLMLTRAYMDLQGPGWLRQGIGREVLVRVHDFSGLKIAAPEDDGHRREDGSHLTADAPGFIAKMRAEGKIVPSTEDRYQEQEDED